MSYAEVAALTGIREDTLWHVFNYDRTAKGERAKNSNRGGLTTNTIERICKAMNCGLRYRPGDGWHATE